MIEFSRHRSVDTSDLLTSCMLCPRKCGVNRLFGEMGVCGSGADIVAARAALHAWEEPSISGTRGSGTVFFSGCNLHCSFCQNEPISRGFTGKVISEGRLAEIFLELQEKGAHNINLVTPTHFIPQIRDALILAKNQGLSLPIVVNSGGYEEVSSLRLWEGLADIYLPDMKFFAAEIARKYCGAPDYFPKAAAAIEEMYRQVGDPVFDEDGLLRRGVIVRHLMLPGGLFDSRKILAYLISTYGNHIYISLMNQYTPPNPPRPGAPKTLLRPDHYRALVDFLIENGQVNAYVQEGGAAEESFIPAFDLTGIDGPSLL